MRGETKERDWKKRIFASYESKILKNLRADIQNLLDVGYAVKNMTSNFHDGRFVIHVYLEHEGEEQ